MKEKKNYNPLKSEKIINDLIADHKSSREFSRAIAEDPSDILKWRRGEKPIPVRAVINICRIFGIKPYDLNPVFPMDLEFVFKKK